MPIRYSSVVGGSSSSGFNLDIGSSGNTTFVFSEAQPAGGYSITSQLADSTIEFYAIAEDGTLAGYTNTKALTATQDFDTMVVYGATNNDLITFEFKPTTLPTANGDQDSGAAPFLTSATPTTLASVDDTTTVTGGNFANNVEIVFTGQDDVDRAAKNIVRSSSTSLIVTRPDAFPVEQEPYSLAVTNPGITASSIVSNTLSDYFDAGGGITWVTTSPLATAFENQAYSATIEATDADGTSVSYAITTGVLPTGLSLDSSTGVISGTPTTPESQTFTITATDSGGNNSTREFALTVVSPTFQSEYLIIAGGGHGGGNVSGGGGAGGYRSSVTGEDSGGGATAESPISLTVNNSYLVTVGAGGAAYSENGNNSALHDIISIGGGAGANSSTPASQGGSGGGGSFQSVSPGSGTEDQGYAGGLGTGSAGAGAGGGAGGVGNTASGGTGGNGGPGIYSSITGSSVPRAGGGGGGSWSNGGISSGGIGGGGNGGDGYTTSTPNPVLATSGQVNTGGGGGGGSYFNGTGAPGGSGIVILKYLDVYTVSVGAGLTSSTDSSSVPGYRITTFTSGTDTITFS